MIINTIMCFDDECNQKLRLISLKKAQNKSYFSDACDTIEFNKKKQYMKEWI